MRNSSTDCEDCRFIGTKEYFREGSANPCRSAFSAHSVPKITNLRESARFAGVFCNRHRYCFVIDVGAGSARPNMVQTTDCTDSYRLLFWGTEYTERTEYHGFYF